MLRHVVLDIDECLLHTFTEDIDWELYRDLRNDAATRDRVAKISFGTNSFWFAKRPGLVEFLDFCFEHFETVTVWSAGVTPYVEAVVAKLFKKKKPHLVMTRSHVLRNSLDPDVVSYSKPLLFYFERMPQATPETTVLIDDRRENSKYDPENIIHIPEYDVTQDRDEIEQGDRTLRNLKEWLYSLDRETDIRCFDHSRAF